MDFKKGTSYSCRKYNYKTREKSMNGATDLNVYFSCAIYLWNLFRDHRIKLIVYLCNTFSESLRDRQSNYNLEWLVSIVESEIVEEYVRM